MPSTPLTCGQNGVTRIEILTIKLDGESFACYVIEIPSGMGRMRSLGCTVATR